MNTTPHKIKVFEENRVAQRAPGAAPGTWIVKSKSMPVAEAINYWLQETGNTLVACSPPGFHVQWLDKEMTTRAIILAVTVTYTEGPHERTIDLGAPAREPAEPRPAGPAAPADARPAGPAARAPGDGYGPYGG